MSDRIRQGAVVLAAVAQVAAGSLLQAVGDRPAIGTISERYPTLIVPAGWAFSIWGLIYLWTGAYAVYQALPAQRENPLLRRVGWPTVVAFVGSSLWIAAFQRLQFELSVLIMLTILGALIAAVAVCTRWARAKGDRWWVAAPLSIYLGWISVATVANVSQTLVARGWPSDALAWAVVVLSVVGVVLAGVVVATRGNAFFTLTVVWALVGTAARRYRAADDVPLVAAVALGVVVLLLAALFIARRTRNKRVGETYA
ncbi:MAG: hypothetical protein WBA12_07895 [Catalinimonas sp.]